MRSLLVVVVVSVILAACQSNESTVTGLLLGADGMPMPLAHVRLAEATLVPASLSRQHGPVLKTEQVQADGTFRISTHDIGPLVLMCSGVGHDALCIPVPLEDHAALSVDIRLAQAFCDTSRSEIEILASSDNGATTQTIPLAKQPDGSFRADVPAVGDSIQYMMFGTSGNGTATTLIGSSADRYQIATREEYVCVVSARNGHAVIEYRPPQQTMAQGGTVTYHDSSSVFAAFARLQDGFAGHVATANADLKSHLSKGLPLGSFSYPWLELATTLAKDALHTENTLLKDELNLEVLECHQRAAVPIRDQTRRELLATVLPTSLVWAYHGSLGLATRDLPSMGDEYFAAIISTHPSRSYAAYLLFYECAEAQLAHNEQKVLRILARLETEFKNTSGAQVAQALYAPRHPIQVGSPLPEFSFRSADDSTVLFTNTTFHGRHLLVVFWATWCTPCVGEIPTLHRIWDKYTADGLSILSVSLGNTPSEIAHFRKLRSPMPWSVVLVPKDEVPFISRRFDAGTGTHILVDPGGKVLERGGLKDIRLDATLNHRLGTIKRSSR